MLCCRTSWLIFAATVARQIRKPLGHWHLELFFSMLPSRLVFLSFPTKNGGIMWYPVFPLRFLESNILITVPFWIQKSCCYVSRLFFRRVSFGGYIPQAQILAFVYRSIYFAHPYLTSWSKRQLIVKIWGQCPTLIFVIFMRLGELYNAVEGFKFWKLLVDSHSPVFFVKVINFARS